MIFLLGNGSIYTSWSNQEQETSNGREGNPEEAEERPHSRYLRRGAHSSDRSGTSHGQSRVKTYIQWNDVTQQKCFQNPNGQEWRNMKDTHPQTTM